MNHDTPENAIANARFMMELSRFATRLKHNSQIYTNPIATIDSELAFMTDGLMPARKSWMARNEPAERRGI